MVSDLGRPRDPPVTCALQLLDQPDATAHSRVPLRMPRSGNFISGQKKRDSLGAIAIRDLSPNQGSKNPLRAESARGPGLWATEESWEPREVKSVCCGAGHQDDQLSTDRQVALQRGPLE